MITHTVPLNYLRGNSFSQPCGMTNDYSNDPRPFHSFAYIVSGEATFFSEREQLRLVAGDIVYVPKGCRYHSLWTGAPETNFLSYHFDLVPFGEPFGSRIYPLQSLRACQALYEDFLRIVNASTDIAESFETLGRFFHILSVLLPRMISTPAPSINEAILRATRYIEAHYDTPLRIPELARLCHLSPSYFYECFKRETGKTPIEYKNGIAISNAQRILLDQPNIPIEEISEKLGFESPIYFRRLFKARTGKTPREYRNTTKRDF